MNSKIYKMLADKLGGMPDKLGEEEMMPKKHATSLTIMIGEPEEELEEEDEEEKKMPFKPY